MCMSRASSSISADFVVRVRYDSAYVSYKIHLLHKHTNKCSCVKKDVYKKIFLYPFYIKMYHLEDVSNATHIHVCIRGGFG